MKSISRVAPFLFGRFYVRLISELRIIGTAIACTNEYGLFGCSEVLNTKAKNVATFSECFVANNAVCA